MVSGIPCAYVLVYKDLGTFGVLFGVVAALYAFAGVNMVACFRFLGMYLVKYLYYI